MSNKFYFEYSVDDQLKISIYLFKKFITNCKQFIHRGRN